MPLLPAFAKLNLGLKVLFRRSDNFHEIATVFQTISLADSLEVTATRAAITSIDVESDTEIPGENLAVKAARLFLESTGLTAQVCIRISKRIPMGGGLGGGSTDAAALLLALPALLDHPTSLATLHNLATQLGSDLPFFLIGGTALATGRGEILEALPDQPNIHGVLIAPGLHISTPEAYRQLSRPAQVELTERSQVAIMERFRSLVRSLHEMQPPAVWAGFCENDFEPVAFKQHASLQILLDQITATGAQPAVMSGSGSTLFGLYASAEAAAAAEAMLRDELSGHATVISQKQFQVEQFHGISRRHYERAWHTALSSFTDGASWPPRS